MTFPKSAKFAYFCMNVHRLVFRDSKKKYSPGMGQKRGVREKIKIILKCEKLQRGFGVGRFHTFTEKAENGGGHSGVRNAVHNEGKAYN